jgi:hypothetical protein
MTCPSFIETYRVEHRVCDRIIEFYRLNREHAQPGRLGGQPRIDKSIKDSLDLSIPIRIYGHLDPFFEQLIGHVNGYLKKYFYDAGGEDFGLLGFSQHANIQWYPVGGGYPALHCERDRIEYCRRALVWMLYLTDTPNGGTEFPHQGVKTECIKGDLLLWPSDLTHMHRGIVSPTHEKMIFTGWIDFIAPPQSASGN